MEEQKTMTVNTATEIVGVTETYCVKHPVDKLVVYNSDKFEFKCEECGKIIAKENKKVFEMAKAMIEMLTSMGEMFSEESK